MKLNLVSTVKITDNSWLEYSGDSDEDEILLRADRRRAEDTRIVIRNFFDSNPTTTYSCKDAVNQLKLVVGKQDRQIQTYLSELSKAKKIEAVNGYYHSVNYVYKPNEDGGSYE